MFDDALSLDSYGIELRRAGAETPQFWLTHFLAMANDADAIGRADLAGRIMGCAAELLLDWPTSIALPTLDATPGVPIHAYGLEDFTDISTLYVCRGLLNRKALLGLPVPAIAYCLPAITAVNDFVRANQVKTLVLCSDGEKAAIDEMKRLRAFVRVDSILFVTEGRTVRDAIADGLDAPTLRCLTKDLLWRKPE